MLLTNKKLECARMDSKKIWRILQDMESHSKDKKNEAPAWKAKTIIEICVAIHFFF